MKHLKLYEDFGKRPADMSKWLDAFMSFLDATWQEDTEIQIVSQLSEYKDKFKSNPSAAWEYFQNWNKANKAAVDKALGVSTTEEFMIKYSDLLDGDPMPA